MAARCMQHVNHTFSKAGLEGNTEEERVASHLQNIFKYLPLYAKARIHGFAGPRRIHRPGPRSHCHKHSPSREWTDQPRPAPLPLLTSHLCAAEPRLGLVHRLN
ncbi:netrin receptor UNC5A [Platysternon megacephalum]|uniref:Netrin receptor UNC5A n=1 Tax=Platysternon megacephalum TaxID=55544 RepID=A0A4D9E117_9SAUR|nr:netrin receptor UNC5A [Platysternon megacephalum]